LKNGIIKCPECGSTETKKLGFLLTRKGKKQRYQCKNCVLTFTVGTKIIESEKGERN